MKVLLGLLLVILATGCAGNKIAPELKNTFQKVAFVSNYKDSISYYTSERGIWRADGSTGGLIGALVAEAISGYDKDKLTSVKLTNLNKNIQQNLDQFVKTNNYSFKTERLVIKQNASKDEVLAEAKKQNFSHIFLLSPTLPNTSALPPEAGGILISPSSEINEEDHALILVSNFCSLELIDVKTNNVLKDLRCYEEIKGEKNSLVLLEKYSDYNAEEKKSLNSSIIKKLRTQLKETISLLEL